MEKTEKRLEAIRNSEIRKKLDDIDLNLNWGEFAHNYFDRSASATLPTGSGVQRTICKVPAYLLFLITNGRNGDYGHGHRRNPVAFFIPE